MPIVVVTCEGSCAVRVDVYLGDVSVYQGPRPRLLLGGRRLPGPTSPSSPRRSTSTRAHVPVFSSEVDVYLGDVPVYLGDVPVYLGDVPVYLGDVPVYLGDVSIYLGEVYFQVRGNFPVPGWVSPFTTTGAGRITLISPPPPRLPVNLWLSLLPGTGPVASKRVAV
jgi:hypothetical protein